MNPNTHLIRNSDSSNPASRGRDFLSDNDLYHYARRYFDLVDPDHVERELAIDPVARHRLRQIQDNIREHREARILEGIAKRVAEAAAAVVPAEAGAATAATPPPTPALTLADWIDSMGIRITLHVRRLTDSLDALESACGWRELPYVESAMLGARSAESASDRPSQRRVLQFRDRSQNRITLAHSPEGCDIGVLLLSAPGPMAILELAQPFDPKNPQPAPARTAVVQDRAALFNNCPAGLYHLTGVEGLDVWILIEPD
jgi:hypothetical protein